MRLLPVLLVAFLVSHCGNGMSVDPTSPRFLYKGLKGMPGKYRDPELQTVLDQFIDDARSHGLDPWKDKQLRVIDFQDGLSQGNMPPIKGTHAEGHAPAGICIAAKEVNPANKKTIATHRFVYIDANLKKMIGTPYFKAIAYHEFFHCLFGGQHTEPLDMKDVATPTQRMQGNADLLAEEARHAYFDEIAQRHDIMAPGLLYDQGFWEYKWDEMVDKLFNH